VSPDGDGLRWSFELDLVSVLEAIGQPLRDWDGVDQDEDLAAELASLDLLDAPPEPGDVPAAPGACPPVPGGPGDGPAGPEGSWAAAGAVPARPAGLRPGARGADISGVVAEALPAGPGLAAWLAGQDPATATGRDLAGMAGAFRRVASWAQSRELDLISHLAARSAAADPKAGLGPDGRPAYVTDDAAAQVSLELALSRTGAEAWAALAVTLRWRLPATAAALADGRIDTYRAKILAEAVTPLSDAAAKAVEDAVIPRAGDLTYGQLHAAVRRAVIAADPEGAEHRRQAAERRAKVSLYPDLDGTATLIGMCLPALQAAAAYARICAVARAMKAAGAGGGIHFLRCQALLGLINQALPPIPPPAGSPPDNEPPPGDADDGWSPGTHGEPPTQPVPGPGPVPGRGSGPGQGPGSGQGSGPASGPGAGAVGSPPPEAAAGKGSAPQPGPGTHTAGPPAQATDPCPDMPPLTDADLPADDGYRDTTPPPFDEDDGWDPRRGDPLDDRSAPPAVQWPWPPIPPAVPATPGTGPPGAGPPDPGPPDTADPPGSASRPPPNGLLDLTLPWATFMGAAERPGILGRIGPITAPQARQAVNLALRDPRTRWRVVLVDPGGRAIATARVPRARPAAGRRDPTAAATPAATDAAVTTPVVGRVTLVMPADAAGTALAPQTGDGIYARILAAARRARDQARQHADADQHAPGGCAHTTASPAYQPPPRIRDHVTARDQTCRHPTCGQPAWRADLDHTTPFHHGGPTCACNLGALCRTHHQLKQHPGWTLTQPRSGTFHWTTPAGRTYVAEPDPYFGG
jgi:Domain of unknown function (DUF222)